VPDHALAGQGLGGLGTSGVGLVGEKFGLMAGGFFFHGFAEVVPEAPLIRNLNRLSAPRSAASFGCVRNLAALPWTVSSARPRL
jgi:hypothetical protein